jgi:hypothetical protein
MSGVITRTKVRARTHTRKRARVPYYNRSRTAFDWLNRVAVAYYVPGSPFPVRTPTGTPGVAALRSINNEGAPLLRNFNTHIGSFDVPLEVGARRRASPRYPSQLWIKLGLDGQAGSIPADVGLTYRERDAVNQRVRGRTPAIRALNDRLQAAVLNAISAHYRERHARAEFPR